MSSKPNQNSSTKPIVTQQILERSKNNTFWKFAFATGKRGQIVFMNITPETSGNNEIGMETHPFEQVILVTEGRGKTVLDGKNFEVNSGDMIFIPAGTQHNVINLNKDKPLKILSFYSDNDIPADSAFKHKKDEPHDH